MFFSSPAQSPTEGSSLFKKILSYGLTAIGSGLLFGALSNAHTKYNLSVKFSDKDNTIISKLLQESRDAVSSEQIAAVKGKIDLIRDSINSSSQYTTKQKNKLLEQLQEVQKVIDSKPAPQPAPQPKAQQKK